ncbi:MAG: HipA domain-containing protein [Acetobacter sp.]|nr:HipA domain-containing protein [Acetobacter sp.]
MRLTQALTRDVREVEKIFRLMMFNVRIGNKDDHSKNFSFVMNEDGEWKLSPAYDLTPSEGINGEHTAWSTAKAQTSPMTILKLLQNVSGLRGNNP